MFDKKRTFSDNLLTSLVYKSNNFPYTRFQFKLLLLCGTNLDFHHCKESMIRTKLKHSLKFKEAELGKLSCGSVISVDSAASFVAL